MLSTVAVLVLILSWCLAADPSNCLTTFYFGMTSCNVTDTPGKLATSTVTQRSHCGKACSELPVCKAMEVQPAAESNSYVCKLYSSHWSKGNCTPSKTHYDKVVCKNGGVLKERTCRCVDGYVGEMCEDIMKDCNEGHTSGEYSKSGVYKVWPKTAPFPFQVFCVFSVKSGKTVIQRHSENGGVIFNRTWDEYDAGFGILDGDHWLGNTYFHYLTQKEPLPALTVSLIAGGTWKVRYYFGFNLTDRKNLFRFSSDWSETEAVVENSLGDCLTLLIGYGFSTFDRDNDGLSWSHCGQRRSSGWWFDKCLKCDLNAKVTGQVYSDESHVNWTPGLDQSLPITSTEMTLVG